MSRGGSSSRAASASAAASRGSFLSVLTVALAFVLHGVHLTAMPMMAGAAAMEAHAHPPGSDGSALFTALMLGIWAVNVLGVLLGARTLWICRHGGGSHGSGGSGAVGLATCRVVAVISICIGVGSAAMMAKM